MEYSLADELRIAALQIYIAANYDDYNAVDDAYDAERIAELQRQLCEQKKLSKELTDKITETTRLLLPFLSK